MSLRGGRPEPDDYPVPPEHRGKHVEDVPPQVLDQLAAYHGYGQREPEGEPIPDDEQFV